VAIARTLVGDPLLFLADEPTGNLDGQSANDIMQIFLNLNTNQHLTVLMVTHDPSLAARCPRRILMRDGRVVDDDFDEPRSVRRRA